MAILSYQPNFVGETDVKPRLVRLVVNDSYATLTTAGYLTSFLMSSEPLEPTDYIFATYGADSTSHAILTPSISNGVVTLIPLPISSGDVLLPVLANHLAVFTNTAGQVGDPSATAIHGGNLQAGLSGTAGYVASFPATAAKGSLHLTGVANTGDTITTISNAAMGQASVISIPDPAGATADFVIAPAALVNNNLVKASGTTGLVADTGIAAAAVQLSANIKSNVLSYGGGGTGPSFTIAGLTTSSIILTQIASSTNVVVIDSAKVTAPDTLTLNFSADPGAATTVNYIAFVVPQ